MKTMAKPDSGPLRIIEEPVNAEPEPIWADAPCLCPERDFPVYRYVRGLNPHPTRDERGHSYGTQDEAHIFRAGNRWRENEDYLQGIDLYHQSFFWEAHEAWEAQWKLAPDDSAESNLLQALILIAAAQIKITQGNGRGVRTHSQAARWRLARLRTKGFDGPEHRFMGLDVAELIEQVCRFYGPTWTQKDDRHVQVKGEAPRLVVEED